MLLNARPVIRLLADKQAKLAQRGLYYLIVCKGTYYTLEKGSELAVSHQMGLAALIRPFGPKPRVTPTLKVTNAATGLPEALNSVIRVTSNGNKLRLIK